MLQQVLQFTKRPIYEADQNLDLGYRFSCLIKLISWALIISFALLTIVSLIEGALNLDFGKHASENLMEDYSTPIIVFLLVIIAPLFEELIFRGPLYWFRNRTSLKIALYISIIAFGFIHLYNFEDYTTHWWMAPLLVAPQLSLGMFAGFIRIRFGLLWAIALHAGYNLLIALPLVMADLLNISWE